MEIAIEKVWTEVLALAKIQKMQPIFSRKWFEDLWNSTAKKRHNMETITHGWKLLNGSIYHDKSNSSNTRHKIKRYLSVSHHRAKTINTQTSKSVHALCRAEF